MPKTYTDEQLLRLCVDSANEKLAEDVVTLEIGHASSIADYFVIASGTSSTHVKSLADDVEYELEQIGVHDGHIEGRATGWVLLDYGAVRVHVFDKQSREYYNLERLWTDAQVLDISEIVKD